MYSFSKSIILKTKDSSSLYVSNPNSEIEDIETITFDKIEIEKIDLLKINIEGAEYDLLEDMIKKNLVSKCNNIQVQFHTFISGYKERYELIKYGLSQTHELTWN